VHKKAKREKTVLEQVNGKLLINYVNISSSTESYSENGIESAFNDNQT
jgi:hypothetical protein